jgi:hypothetical protein
LLLLQVVPAAIEAPLDEQLEPEAIEAPLPAQHEPAPAVFALEQLVPEAIVALVVEQPESAPAVFTPADEHLEASQVPAAFISAHLAGSQAAPEAIACVHFAGSHVPEAVFAPALHFETSHAAPLPAVLIEAVLLLHELPSHA